MTETNQPSIEPTAAMLTPAGRGAIAVLNVRGPVELLDGAFDRFFKAANGRRLSQQAFNRIYYGHWGVDVVEDLVICRVDEVTVEVHCHGGLAAPRRILNDLAQSGFQTRTWQDQLRETAHPFDVECQETLTKAPTERTALWLLRQTQGRLRTALEELASELRRVGRGARPTDSNCDTGFGGSHASTHPTESPVSELRARLADLVRWGEFGMHLTEAWRVVIAGRPNVGKSTLLNVLLGYRRAIVFDQPGTTRDVVTGETAFSGWPVLLADTAGLRDTSDELEAEGISRAKRVLSEADCRCFVFDLSQPPTTEDNELLALARTQPRSILIGNKSDLPRAWPTDRTNEFLCLSAAQATGLDLLMERIVATLIPEEPAETAAIPITQRQLRCLIAARDELERENWNAAASAICDCLLAASDVIADGGSRTSTHPTKAR
jgi:tRNA modification GTPase